jgi:hypothetical protein
MEEHDSNELALFSSSCQGTLSKKKKEVNNKYCIKVLRSMDGCLRYSVTILCNTCTDSLLLPSHFCRGIGMRCMHVR